MKSYGKCFRTPDAKRPELDLKNLPVEDLKLIKKLAKGELLEVLMVMVPEVILVPSYAEIHFTQ